MRLYLDNCCFNRPYDDQTSLHVSLEAQAKIRIQEMIKNKKAELVTSYVLSYENSQNPHWERREAIRMFLRHNSSLYIGGDRQAEAKQRADAFIMTGLKTNDAYHVSCAILGACEYFITTDYRILRLQTPEILLLNPIDFVRRMETTNAKHK